MSQNCSLQEHNTGPDVRMQSVGREQLVSKLSPHSPVFRPANLSPGSMEPEEGRSKPAVEEQQRTSPTQECTPADWSSPGCSTSTQLAYAQGVACPVTYSQLLPGGLTQQLPAYMWVPVSTQPYVQMSVPPSAAVAVQYTQRSPEERPHGSVPRTRLLAAHMVWRPVRHRQSGSPRLASTPQAQISHHKQGLLLAPTKLVAKTPEDESACSDPESSGEVRSTRWALLGGFVARLNTPLRAGQSCCECVCCTMAILLCGALIRDRMGFHDRANHADDCPASESSFTAAVQAGLQALELLRHQQSAGKAPHSMSVVRSCQACRI